MRRMPHPRTAIEKIAALHAVGWREQVPPRSGDALVIRPRHVMTHDNTSAVIPKFRAIAGPDARVHDPSQPVFAIDHDIQNQSPENLGKYARIRTFAERQGIDFYPPGRGIAHQLMIEEGYIAPGTLVVASDSHANIYGGLACLGTPIVRTDAAAIWATGQTWWSIPPVVRVVLEGTLPASATGKDVILTLCASFSQDEALNCALEFDGRGLASLDIEARLTIANMSTEWGALAAVFPVDDVLERWLRERDMGDSARTAWEQVAPDPGAQYARELTLDLSSVSPYVNGPNSVTTAEPVAAIQTRRIPVHKAYLMSCVNARLGDIEAAARVFEGGRRVAHGVKFYLAAASSRVQDAARASGAWQRLLEAGAIELPAGCGACIGLGQGTLEAGEVGISATNRNFEGRMGSREALCYLASPQVVAESAIRGYIAAPDGSGQALEVRASCRELSRVRRADLHEPAARTRVGHAILPGFPALIRGRSMVLTRDHINTDAIYAAEATYRDSITPAEQGELAMANYDPGFQAIAREGDILIAGRNFGCGSSREQAATALTARGVALIVAASISQTFQRNAFNNGAIAIECPELVDHLRDVLSPAPEIRCVIGPELHVHFDLGLIRCGERKFGFTPPNQTAQSLIVAGGLEAWVSARLHESASHERKEIVV